MEHRLGSENSVTTCLFRKIKSRMNRKIVPHVPDFQMGGVSLDRLKSKVIRRKRTETKLSLQNLNEEDLQVFQIMGIDILQSKFSLTDSKAKILENIIYNCKKGNITLKEESRRNRFDSKGKKKLNKKKLYRIIDEYKRKIKKGNDKKEVLEQSKNGPKKESLLNTDQFNNEPILKEGKKESLEGYEPKLKSSQWKRSALGIEEPKNSNNFDLKKKWSSTSSKGILFDKVLDEHKSRKFSIFKDKKKDTENINQIIKEYKLKNQKEVNAIDIEQLKNVDKGALKQKLYLSNSQGVLFDNLVDEYNSGKLSLSKLTKSKTYPSKIDTKEITKMLGKYKDLHDATMSTLEKKVGSMNDFFHNFSIKNIKKFFGS